MLPIDFVFIGLCVCRLPLFVCVASLALAEIVANCAQYRVDFTVRLHGSGSAATGVWCGAVQDYFQPNGSQQEWRRSKLLAVCRSCHRLSRLCHTHRTGVFVDGAHCVDILH